MRHTYAALLIVQSAHPKVIPTPFRHAIQPSRELHGGENRIRAARFPQTKTLDDFEFAQQRSISRHEIATSPNWTSSAKPTT